MVERSCSVENISNGKPIGIGHMTVLPGETKRVPVMYWGSPVLKMYADLGFLRIIEDGAPEESGAPSNDAASDVPEAVPDAEESGAPVSNDAAPDVPEAVPDAEESAEALRKARLASLNGLDETALGKLAEEIGVNPADCKDTADMRKKVRAALKK